MNAIVNFETNPFEEVELNGEKQLGVNARDLHSWLDSKQDFSKWIKRRITKYGFVEGRDYLTAQVVEQVHHQGGVRSAMIRELDELIQQTQHKLDFDDNQD